MTRLIIAICLNVGIVLGAFYTLGWFLLCKKKEDPWAERLHIFRFFTYLSNILSAVISAILLVLEIGCLKTGNLLLPDWAVLLRLVGTGAVMVTLLTVIFFLAPKDGWFLLYYQDNIFMHVLGPLAAFVLYAVLETGLYVDFATALLGGISVVLYAALYFVKVVIIGEDRGGWPDFYHFNEGGRWYIAMPAMLVAGFAVSELITLVHNLL